VKAWDQDHPDAKPQERAKARLDILQGIGEGHSTIQEQLLRQARLDHPEWGAEEQADFLQQHNVGKVGTSGGAPTKQKEIYRRWQEAVKAHPEWGEQEKEDAYDQASRDVANASQPDMTPNKRIEIEGSIDQYKEAQTKIDTTIKSLETHAAEAGLAGKATRMGERVGNIFGNNSTDREQFMRDIQFLRTGAQKLLFDRTGRPLAADADRINDIIGGLSAGDTTANTLRSLREVKKVLDRLEQDKEKQLKGTWKTDTPASSSVPDNNAKPAWEEAPIVGQ
jgi:hypothetical protein